MFRREFLAGAAVSAAAQLQAQDVRWVKLRVTVTDSQGRYIKGLRPGDFRVLEDGIPRRISSFADGSKELFSDPESGKSGIDLTEGVSHEDPDHSYTITYNPDPSNRNEGFRKILIEIVSDTAKNYRVRTRPGYRPPTARRT